MSNTATLLDRVIDWYPGTAGLYTLDPPLDGNGHVVVWVESGWGHDKVVIVGTDEHGRASVMDALPGSLTGINSPAKALEIAGLITRGAPYTVVLPEPVAPEPDPRIRETPLTPPAEPTP